MPALRRFRTFVAVAGACIVVQACGGGGEGGGVTGSATVTPLNGAWRDASANEFLQFVNPGPSVSLFSPKFDIVRVTLQDSTELCGGSATNSPVDLEGTLDNGKLTLFVAGTQRRTACLVGTFTDQRALNASSPDGKVVRRYLNDRIDVGLGCGLWVGDGGRVKLAFTDPPSVFNGQTADAIGHDVSAGAPGTAFRGTMTGFNAGKPPKIAQLTSDANGAALFSELVFVDGARMEGLDASGRAITLQRQPDPTNGTACNI